MGFKKLASFICIIVSVFIFDNQAVGQSTTFKTGTAIIDMGSASPTVKNSLKPYGLIYALLKNNHVPVSVVVNASKVKDGIDFVYNGKSYKGGTFVISAEYISSTVSSVLTSWVNQGVLIDYTTSDITLDVTYKINFIPKWVMDRANGNIAVGFLNAAGIPSSAFSFKTPDQLNACDDIFVLPHADPTWNSHNNLFFWNKNNKGNIWAGCHAVSALENLSKDTTILGVPTTLKVNFLSTQGLIPFTDHNAAATPFSNFLPADPIAQFLGKTDNAQLGGSETVYLPKSGGAWNASAKILTTSPGQIDIPSLSAGVAVENMYGRGFGDAARGYVAYQASHNIGGTSADQVAAQRIFFNFSLFALTDKVPPIISATLSGLPSQLRAGTASSTLTANVTGSGSGFTYEWSSNIAGVFSASTSATTTFTPSNTITTSTECILTCVVTESCGRVSFDAKKFTVIPQTPPLTAATINQTIPDGCGSGGSVTFNVFDSNVDANAGVRTMVGLTTLANGSVISSTAGSITFTANANYKGTTSANYTLSNDGGITTAVGTINITVGTATDAPVIVGDAAIALVNSIKVIGVLSNDLTKTGASNADGLYIRDIPVKPTKGVVYINAGSRTLSYLSNNGQTGIDEFQYLACNTSGYCAAGTLSVTLVDNCGTGKYQLNQTLVPLNVSLTSTEDSYIDAAATTTNNGTTDPLQFKGATAGTQQRPVISFAGIAAALSTTFVVNQASLVLTTATAYSNTSTTTTAPFPANVNAFIRAWTETGVTWARTDGTTTWGTLGSANTTTDITNTGITTFPFVASTAKAVGDTILADVKTIVQNWVSTPAGNFGFLIRPSVGKATVLSFNSRENGSVSKHPKLSIDYYPCLTTPTNYIPAIYPDAVTTSSSLSVTISPLTNDVNYYSNTNSVFSITTPANGTASINGNQVIYTPNGTFIGTDTLTYTVKDLTNNTTNTTTIRVTVTRVAPTVVNDVTTTNSNTAKTIVVGANDADPQGAMGAPIIVTAPLNGTAVISGNDVLYTPSTGFSGTDNFTYRRLGTATDACSAALSGTATVTITVSNQTPVATNTSIGTFACAPVNINLLTVASDPEGGALSVTITGGPSNGSVSLVGKGTYKYSPTANFTGVDQFTYTVTDPLNATSLAATVTITVSGAANPNTAPIAVADADNTLLNQLLYTNVLANDSDPNSDPIISVTIVTQPLSGTVFVMPNKLIRYTPATGFTGTETYRYQITDSHPDCGAGGSLSAIAIVTITVTATPTTLSGTVYNDADVSGNANFTNIKTNTETGTNANGSLYIYLVDASNIIKDRTPVDVDGTYSLSNVPSLTSNLKLIVSIQDINIGGTLTAPSLPPGYVNSSPLTRTLATTTLADMGGFNWGIYTNSTLTGGTITGPGDLCGTSGIPGSFTATANALGGSLTATAYKYQWQSSIVSAVAGFADISSADTLTGYTPTSAINATTYYRRTVVTKNAVWQDINSAKFSNVVTVTLNPNPTVTISPLTATVQSGASQTITAIGATSYLWYPASNLSATNTAVVTAGSLTTTTTYTVTGTITATGCLNTATITITVINPGVIGSDQTSCGTFTPTTLSSTSDASGATPITYQWQLSTTSTTSGFANINGATGSTYSPVGVSVTTYYRRVATFAGSSFNSNVVTVTLNPNPTVTMSPLTATVLTGASQTITATGAVSYSWYPASNLSATNTAVVTAGSLTTTTTYTVTGTITATGCLNTATITITVINPGVIGSDQTSCGTFTPTTLSSTSDASGATPITYQWQLSTTSTSSGFVNIDGATGNTFSPVGVSATTYYRRVASFAGSSFNSNAITATVKPKPSVTATSNSPVCRGAAINLSSTAGMSGYVWTGPNAFSSVVQNPVISTSTLSSTGTYTVTVTAANGCTNTASTAVIVNNNPTVTITPSTASINLNANISLTAAGADTYSWSPTTGLSLTNTATVIAAPLTTTFYTVTGTISTTGCTATASLTVTVVGSLTLLPGSIGSPQTICSGAAASAFTSTSATGGTGSISYQWQQSADNIAFTNITSATLSTYAPPALTQTTYYRRSASTSIDAAVFTASVKVTVQLSVSGTITSSSLTVCVAGNSGTLTLTGSTGNILKWQSSKDGGASFTDLANTTAVQTFQNLTLTTQYRTVVQAGVCAIVNSEPLTVTVLPLPVAGPISGPCALPKDSSGVYSLTAVANATSYAWALPVGWTGVSTTNSITVTAGSANGTISVTPSNNGCAGTPVTFQARIIDYARVTITGTPVSASGNNNNPIVVTIQLIDVSGNLITCSGGKATLCANSGTFSTVVDNNNGTYTASLISSANDVVICGTVAGIPISNTTKVTFTGPQGGIKGNGPILETETPKITFTATAGRAPFTVIYRSAKSNKNDTLTNVISGVSIGVKLIPTTTLYTLVSVIDANGERRDNNFNRDTATIIVVSPRIIVTLHADPAKLEKDSTWSTRLSLKVKNIGELDLTAVQVKLNLKDVFPSPVTYVLDSVRVNGATVVGNRNYDGIQSNDLFARINPNKIKLPAGSLTTAMPDMAMPLSPGTGNMTDNAVATILQKENGIEVYADIRQANNESAIEEIAVENDEHSVYMFGALSQLPVGIESTMFLYIHLKPNGYYEPFLMQAVALGTGSTEGATALTTSLSNDNNDVNAHPDLTKNGDPQPTVITLIPNPVIGVALSAGTPVVQGNGTYNVLLSYKVVNYGNVNLQSLQLFHNLSRMIGSPSTFTRIGAITTTGTLVPNTNYDGKLDTNLLVNTSELAYKQEGTLQFTINITSNQLSSLYRLQAIAAAFNTDISGTVTDLSTDGTNPDPDGNKKPDEKVKTLIVINMPIPPLVPGTIGILVNPSPRTTVLAKTYCASVTGSQIVSTSTPSGGSGPYEYQWQSSVDNSSFTDITNATDSIYTTATISSSIYLRKKVISDNQVAFTNSVFIQIIPVVKPLISASGPLTLVVNGSVTLTSTASSSYVWSSLATTRSITVTTPGVGPYTVTVTDANGCPAVSDPVVVLPPPPVTVNATYIIGAISNPPNSGVQVTGYLTATLNYYIVSSGGVLIPVPVLPPNTGLFTYYVSQTINGYESARVPYTVTMLDKVADVEKILSKAPSLQPDGGYLLGFTIYSSNFRNELLDSVKIKDDLSKVFPSNTTYQVVSVKSSGKLLTNPLYNGNTQIDLLADVSQLAGLQKDSVVVTLKVFSNGFSGTLNNVAEQQAKSPFGTFKVTSNDPTVGNGLAVRAPTRFVIPMVDLFIPSGFSPNRDGTNDLFVIRKPFNISINMEIFNRWGNLVYRAPDYKNDWDGKGNQPNIMLGEDLPNGTYYYVILATDKLNGTVTKFAGFITLKR